MMRKINLLRSLWQDCQGTALIETAIVTPVLAIMALGGFEASAMVARQTELQSAAAEAAAIVRTAPPQTAADRTVIHDILAVSTGLSAQSIVISQTYRCGTAAEYTDDDTSCGTAALSTYVMIEINDTYEPQWTKFGIGTAHQYNIVRTVQIS